MSRLPYRYLTNCFSRIYFDLYILLWLCNYMDNYYNQTKSDKWYLMAKFKFLVHSFMFNKLDIFLNPRIIGLLAIIRFKLQLRTAAIFLLPKPIRFFLCFDEVLLLNNCAINSTCHAFGISYHYGILPLLH